MEMVCENGVVEHFNNVEYLKCLIVNDYCPYIRFCPNDMCVKMTPNFHDCVHRNSKEGK